LPSFASTSSPVRQCPCKLLPRSFSSFTAAEYGDLSTLAKIGPAIAHRHDDFGYTPLHLAAQNNHVAATALLLQLGCHVDGIVSAQGDSNHTSTTRFCGATPLHRAAFSGATATMKILLDWNCSTEPKKSSSVYSKQQCNLLAKDFSIGDDFTPLHKAAAGGRYLAIKLLLEAMQSRLDPEFNPSCATLLHRALKAKDRWARSPVDVARYYLTIQETERHAVARWDGVAGGPPDWMKCVQLLENVANVSTSKSTVTTKKRSEEASNAPQPPSYLFGGVKACIDCNGNGRCLTTLWEKAFHEALIRSATETLEAAARQQQVVLKVKKDRPESDESSTKPINEKKSDCSASTLAVAEPPFVGISCGQCGKRTISLYPIAPLNQLVCKPCSRSKK
jgi:ankyrin repeat protein